MDYDYLFKELDNLNKDDSSIKCSENECNFIQKYSIISCKECGDIISNILDTRPFYVRGRTTAGTLHRRLIIGNPLPMSNRTMRLNYHGNYAGSHLSAWKGVGLLQS